MTDRTVRLFIVEDSLAYLQLIREAFSSSQLGSLWEITAAHDGEEALTVIQHAENSGRAPDLILLDWHLPKISGSEVLRQLKSHREFRKIPVLIFSSSNAQLDIHEAYGHHANGFITKPTDLDALFQIAIAIEVFWVATVQLTSDRKAPRFAA